MPGVVEDYVKSQYRSAQFGSVSTANTVMPDGRLGMTEKRSHFEFKRTRDGQYEAVLARTAYLHQGGRTVGVRDLNGGFDRRRNMGSFETLDGAKEYASRFIQDYKQTAREEYQYAVQHQQREDRYAVYGEPKEKTMQDLEANLINGSYEGTVVEVNDRHIVQELNKAARVLHSREVLKEAAPQLNQHVRIAYSANVPSVTAVAPKKGRSVARSLHV